MLVGDWKGTEGWWEAHDCLSHSDGSPVVSVSYYCTVNDHKFGVLEQ